jgi:hypothetical protein
MLAFPGQVPSVTLGTSSSSHCLLLRARTPLCIILLSETATHITSPPVGPPILRVVIGSHHLRITRRPHRPVHAGRAFLGSHSSAPRISQPTVTQTKNCHPTRLTTCGLILHPSVSGLCPQYQIHRLWSVCSTFRASLTICIVVLVALHD